MIWRCDSAAVSVWVDKKRCCWWQTELAVQQNGKGAKLWMLWFSSLFMCFAVYGYRYYHTALSDISKKKRAFFAVRCKGYCFHMEILI